MKKIIFFTILIVSVSCKSQQTFPLNTDFDNVPQNSYLKDLNNELNAYIGIYKASFQDKEITLFITKETMKYFNALHVYKDALSIRYIVKNPTGTILQDTQNMAFQANQYKYTIFSQGTYPNQNIVWFNYGGTNCRVGWGAIELKYLNTTQISWEYRPNNTILGYDCPANADKTVYLPVTKDLIFTKQ